MRALAVFAVLWLVHLSACAGPRSAAPVPAAKAPPPAATADATDCRAALAKAADPERPDVASFLAVERLLPDCAAALEAPLAELVAAWHRHAYQMAAPAEEEATDRLYGLVLAQYPTGVASPKLRYHHAELLWKRAERDPSQWTTAAAAYALAAHDEALPMAERREAAYARVLALKNALSVAVHVDSSPRDPTPDPPQPEPIPPEELALIEAFDDYIALGGRPDTDELVTMRFLKGRIYWRYGHLEAAVPALEEVIETAPDHEVAEYAVNLLLDSLNRLQRYDAMKVWVRRLRAEARFAGLRGRVEILETLAKQFERREAEDLERAGDHAGCGAAYERLADADPQQSQADELRYNAGVCFEQAGRPADARRNYELLLKRYRRSPLAAKARERLKQLPPP